MKTEIIETKKLTTTITITTGKFAKTEFTIQGEPEHITKFDIKKISEKIKEIKTHIIEWEKMEAL